MQVQPAADAGELLLFGFEGTQPQELPEDLVRQCGGVILFRRNISSVQQLRALTDAIRTVDRAGRPPPLVAIDQEGGTVSRLSGIGTTTPAAMALGAASDASLTQSMYELIGSELAALGVNLDLAPVADVNNNAQNPVVGLRSFGDDPREVARHVAAAIRGLRRAGVGATAKHFPGHGDTTVDSHLDLPSLAHDLVRAQAVELVPFSAAIAEGVDVIMTAHVAFSALDPSGRPATLSCEILAGLLRNRLGYNGVICTDCLEMQAIAARYAPHEAALAAVQAGADLVLFSHSVDKTRSSLRALRQALQDGSLRTQRIEESVRRIRALQQSVAGPRAARSFMGAVGSIEHQAAALEAARRAVTLIRDPQSLIPFDLEKTQRLLVVEFSGDPAVLVEDRQQRRRTTAIGAHLATRRARIHEQVRSLDPSGHEYKQLLMAAGPADAVIALTSRAWQHPLQVRSVADLAMLGKRVVAIAVREPYDAMALPPEVTVVASYGSDSHAMQAAAEVILGQRRAPGKLPVALAPAAAS